MTEIRFRKSEIFRYMGMRGLQMQTPQDMSVLSALVDETADRMREGVRPRHAVKEFLLDFPETGICFIDGGGQECLLVRSEGLKSNLAGCRRALLFAATLGEFPDRLVRRYELSSMAKAAAAQAAGAEFIEAYCDEVMQELEEKYRAQALYLKPRFSPGYGDFALDHQRDFFRLLDLERVLRIRLTESLLMVPTKSVTAVIGLTDNPEKCHISRCTACGRTDCEFRTADR